MKKQPHDGEALKNKAFDLLAIHRERFILLGRRALLNKLLIHGNGTADDVREVVELPPGIDPKCFGSVPGALAKAGIICQGGFVRTCRLKAHARTVSIWKLIDAEKARKWLADHPEPDGPPPQEKAQRQRELPLGE